MARKQLRQVKEGKLLAKGDWIVYGILLLAVIALVIAFVLPPTEQLEGVTFERNGVLLGTFVFGESAPELTEEGKQACEVSQQDGLIFVVVFADETQEKYNRIVLDNATRKAYVDQANCSIGADCTHSPAITTKGGSIVCVPHGLIVKGIGAQYTPPISG